MGETVGPALAKQLISDLGADKVAIQGVDYPATIESNISLGSEGGPTMVCFPCNIVRRVENPANH